MTPLAQKFLRDYARTAHTRIALDPFAVTPHFISAKCFEVSSIINFACEAYGHLQIFDESIIERVFLPANPCFIEWKTYEGRAGFLLVQNENKISMYYCVSDNMVALGACLCPGFLPHSSDPEPGFQVGINPSSMLDFYNKHIDTTVKIAMIYNLLALINTPHIVGQRQHQPHAGLQRKIAKAKGMVGKFPLRAWTEIKLWCSEDDIREVASDQVVELRLSGSRCLHFVRSFLRWRRGQLERVKAHWRGDPALGMKRSRYNAQMRDPH